MFEVRERGLPNALPSPYAVTFKVYPPDRRKRDLDNVLKASIDALQHCGLIDDDANIWRLEVERGEVVKGGYIEVGIITYDPNPQKL